MGKRLISVIVVTYKKCKLFKKCLDSLYNQSLGRERYEILVVDDANDKKTKDLVGKYEGVEYYPNTNKGHGACCNVGITKSNSELLAFITDDCVAENEWIEKIITSFRENEDISGLGGAVINPFKSKMQWADYISNFSSFFPGGKVKKVDYITSCNCGFRKRDIQNIGFAELFPHMNYDETVLLYKLKKANKKILFDPRLRVLHLNDRDDTISFLKKQRDQGIGFKNYYYTHGLGGRILFKFKFLNYLCPRILPLFLRCLKSKRFLFQFLRCLPLLIRGEFERAKVINS